MSICLTTALIILFVLGAVASFTRPRSRFGESSATFDIDRDYIQIPSTKPRRKKKPKRPLQNAR